MKILVMLSRVPYPLIKGDKLRAYHHIKELSVKHEIILCAITDEKIHPEAIPELKKFCKEVYVFSLSKPVIFINIIRAFFLSLPLQVGYFFSSKTKKAIHSIINTYKPDHIFCQLIRVAEYVKDINIPKTLDYQDVFSKGIERRLKAASLFQKPLLKLEYKRLLKYEHDIFGSFTHKIIISEPDRILIPHPQKNDIHVVPNGVDTDFFKPRASEKSYELVFTGNMGYPPNVNAVIYIAKEIMPLLLKEKPHIRLLVAGARPAKSVLQLQSPNIIVSGWVKDIRSSYAQSKIFIAPMQIGTGLQNKLLEAMAMRLPCVSSELANRALNAKEGEEILIGKTPDDFVKQIIFLLDNDTEREKLAENGYNFVLNNFNWTKLTEKINDIIKS